MSVIDTQQTQENLRCAEVPNSRGAMANIDRKVSGQRGKGRRIQPYAWLGAGAVTLGLGAAMASGTAIAHADDPASAGNTGASHSQSSNPAQASRVARPSSSSSAAGGSAARKAQKSSPTDTAAAGDTTAPTAAAVSSATGGSAGANATETVATPTATSRAQAKKSVPG